MKKIKNLSSNILLNKLFQKKKKNFKKIINNNLLFYLKKLNDFINNFIN